MLSIDEIKNISEFHLPSVQEGIRQAEQRLSDSLNKKESLDKRSMHLITVFLSFATALLSVPRILSVESTEIYILTIPTGLCFLVGTIYFFVSLKPLEYGTLGYYPDTWLHKSVIDGDDNMHAYVLTCTLRDYQPKITASDESNDRKSKLMNKGITCGIAAPIIFLFILALQYLKFICHPSL